MWNMWSAPPLSFNRIVVGYAIDYTLEMWNCFSTGRQIINIESWVFFLLLTIVGYVLFWLCVDTMSRVDWYQIYRLKNHHSGRWWWYWYNFIYIYSSFCFFANQKERIWKQKQKKRKKNSFAKKKTIMYGIFSPKTINVSKHFTRNRRLNDAHQ